MGTYPITFTARNGVLPDATQSFTLTLVKAEQAITFDPVPDVDFGSPNFTVAATSTTVAFSSLTPSVCTVSTRTVRLVTSTSATLTRDIENYPLLQFSTSGVTINAFAGTVTLTVTLTGSAALAVSVAYASADGTAMAPGDYSAAAGVLTWAVGDGANRTIVIPIVVDAMSEPPERFTVTLISPTGGATLGTRSTVTVTIRAH